MRTRSAAAAVRFLAAALLSASPAAADAAGMPAGTWPTCDAPTDVFCLESATVTPVGGESVPVADHGLTGSASFTGAFNWGVSGLDDPDLPTAVRDGEFTVVIRVNQFLPQYSLAIARDVRVTRVVNGDDTVTMTVTGHAVHRDWVTGEALPACVAGTDCGDENTTADALGTGWVFMGYSQELGSWDAEYAALDGMSIATDAEARPTFILIGTYPELYWSMPVLGNPHLDVNGNPVRGSFHAWLPPTFFTAAGTDVTSAVATGFDVTSSSAGVAVSIPATLSEQDGGVAIDVPDLPYSVHSVTVANRASTAPDGTPPGAPTGVSASLAGATATVHWTAPADHGGLTLGAFTARLFGAPSGGSVVGSCSASGTSCTIAGLTPGATYYAAVTASNTLGEGPASTRVASTPAASVPGAPRSVTVTPAAGRLTAAWSAPVSDGGNALTGYTARAWSAASSGSIVRQCSATPPARTCAITGLTNGVGYHVDVVATNAAGTGTASAPRVAGTPRTVASAPRAVTATSRSRTVTLAWAVPASTGGSPVTGYTASLYASATGGSPAVRCTTAASRRSCTTAALAVGRVYYATVVATNAAGASLPSARVRVVVRR
ncbi:MAG: fibronectin type III domain-containing protein [Kineosporiaceae bacterium]